MAGHARHGPARLGVGPIDAATPRRRDDGALAVVGPDKALASGRVLLGRLPDGTAAAVPSSYVAHLDAARASLEQVATVGDARDLPWPHRSLAMSLAGLGDHEPVPTDWLDDPREAGWAVTAPWQLDAGPLGYGRWLPTPMVAGLRRVGLARHLDDDIDRVESALRWHGRQVEVAQARLDEVLLGWTTPLPVPHVPWRWTEDDEVLVVPDDLLAWQADPEA